MHLRHTSSTQPPILIIPVSDSMNLAAFALAYKKIWSGETSGAGGPSEHATVGSEMKTTLNSECYPADRFHEVRPLFWSFPYEGYARSHQTSASRSGAVPPQILSHAPAYHALFSLARAGRVSTMMGVPLLPFWIITPF